MYKIFRFYQSEGILYHPQTKFGARSYFHKRVSKILFTGGGSGPGGYACSQAGLVLEWCLLPGGMVPAQVGSGTGGCLVLGGGRCSGGCPMPPDGYCYGRYTSYWNAFLFSHVCLSVSRTAHREMSPCDLFNFARTLSSTYPSAPPSQCIKYSGFTSRKVFFTTHKRSLGQGNIFTSVCQKFCSQEGGLVLGGMPALRRVWSWSGACSQGAWCLLKWGLVLGGAWSWEGVAAPGGVPCPPMATATGGTHPTGMHSCSVMCVCLLVGLLTGRCPHVISLILPALCQGPLQPPRTSLPAVNC